MKKKSLIISLVICLVALLSFSLIACISSPQNITMDSAKIAIKFLFKDDLQKSYYGYDNEDRVEEWGIPMYDFESHDVDAGLSPEGFEVRVDGKKIEAKVNVSEPYTPLDENRREPIWNFSFKIEADKDKTVEIDFTKCEIKKQIVDVSQVLSAGANVKYGYVNQDVSELKEYVFDFPNDYVEIKDSVDGKAEFPIGKLGYFFIEDNVDSEIQLMTENCRYAEQLEVIGEKGHSLTPLVYTDSGKDYHVNMFEASTVARGKLELVNVGNNYRRSILKENQFIINTVGNQVEFSGLAKKSCASPDAVNDSPEITLGGEDLYRACSTSYGMCRPDGTTIEYTYDFPDDPTSSKNIYLKLYYSKITTATVVKKVGVGNFEDYDFKLYSYTKSSIAEIPFKTLTAKNFIYDDEAENGSKYIKLNLDNPSDEAYIFNESGNVEHTFLIVPEIREVTRKEELCVPFSLQKVHTISTEAEGEVCSFPDLDENEFYFDDSTIKYYMLPKDGGFETYLGYDKNATAATYNVSISIPIFDWLKGKVHRIEYFENGVKKDEKNVEDDNFDVVKCSFELTEEECLDGLDFKFVLYYKDKAQVKPKIEIDPDIGEVYCADARKGNGEFDWRKVTDTTEVKLVDHGKINDLYFYYKPSEGHDSLSVSIYVYAGEENFYDYDVGDYVVRTKYEAIGNLETYGDIFRHMFFIENNGKNCFVEVFKCFEGMKFTQFNVPAGKPQYKLVVIGN